MTALRIAGRFIDSMSGQLLQVIPDIPLTTATTGKRARPIGNVPDIHTLIEQALDFFSRGASAMTHHFIS